VLRFSPRPVKELLYIDVALLNAAGNNGGAIITIQNPTQFYAYQPLSSSRPANGFSVKYFRQRIVPFTHTACPRFVIPRSEPSSVAIRGGRKWTIAMRHVLFTHTRGERVGIPSFRVGNDTIIFPIPPRRGITRKKIALRKGGFRQYEKATGVHHPYFVPETFDLTVDKQATEFERRLFEQGGFDHPWVPKIPNVTQGKGITMLGPNSEGL
jgi:hypothetical protein